MGRFSRLEWEERGPERPVVPPVDPWPDQDEDACLREGDARFHRGEYEAALAAFSRALRFNRDREAAWSGQARTLLSLEEWKEALTWSERGLDRCRDAADLLAAKGLALVLTGQRQEGMEYLDGAVEKRTPSSWVFLARGEGLLALREDPENVQRCFGRAVHLGDDDWRVPLRVGIAYNRYSQYARARVPLSNVVRAAEENPLACYEMGRTLEGLGEWQSAAGWYQRALLHRPEYPAAREAMLRVQRTPVVRSLWRRLTGRR